MTSRRGHWRLTREAAPTYVSNPHPQAHRLQDQQTLLLLLRLLLRRENMGNVRRVVSWYSHYSMSASSVLLCLADVSAGSASACSHQACLIRSPVR